MAKFSQIAKGTRARKVVSLEFGATTVPVALLPLDFGAEAAVIERAKAFAKTRGEADPKPKEPLYERGLMLHTVLLTAVDADVLTADEPFFASEAEAMRLDPERIAELYHRQRAHQSEVAPSPRGMTPMEFVTHVISLAKADEEDAADIPFDSLPYATQKRFTRLLARQHFSFILPKSPSGSGLEDTETSSATSATSSSPTPTTPSSPPSPGEDEPSAEAEPQGMFSELDPDDRAALEVMATEGNGGNEDS